ncbi:hypothetical protein LCGC14_2922810, partial [marine sediment metagenome]
MDKNIVLKPATMEDADILLEWRNDSETRKASIKNGFITKKDHLKWLSGIINNPLRRLFVAWLKLEDYYGLSMRVGTIRADYSVPHNYKTIELSWTVAPNFRGQKIGKKMLMMAADRFPHHCIRATIKPDNAASIRMAEYVGMR